MPGPSGGRPWIANEGRRPKEDDVQIVGQGGERKGINRWPFGTLLLIITIDSEFSTKRSFESLSRIKNICQSPTLNPIILNHLHFSSYITSHTEPIMPSHRPQRITKPSARSGNTSGPGQRLTRSTRPPGGGAIVPETQPPPKHSRFGRNTSGRCDRRPPNTGTNPEPAVGPQGSAGGHGDSPQAGDPSPSKANRRKLDGYSAHKGRKHSPEGRQEAHTPHPNQLLPAETEGTDLCLLPLIIEYPAINSIYFRQILNNKFDPINISKLCTDVVLIKPTVKRVNLAKGYELIQKEDDASPGDIKGLPHLIRCLGVYWQVLLHSAPSGIKDSLCRAFQIYQDRLLLHYTIYTWESVRVFHIIFHRGLVYQGVNDPAGWRRSDTTVENMYLTRRTPNLSMTGGTTKLHPGSFPVGGSIEPKPMSCNRYNAGRECKDCRYPHVCSLCFGHHTKNNCPKAHISNPNFMSTGRRD